MMRYTHLLPLSLAFLASTTLAQSPVPEPDVVLYGGILLNGNPIPPSPPNTIVVIAVLQGGMPQEPLDRLATYTVGNNPNAIVDADNDGQVDDAGYVLRIPMEFGGGPLSGNAVILGDTVEIYVEDPPDTFQVMGSMLVTGRGMVTEADLPITKGSCPGDIDADGAVGINDFLALLGAWGPNPGHPADLDGDDIVGITDFLALLAAWGPCP